MGASKPKKLRALFITHSTGIYGAEKSLQSLLKNIINIEVTLIIPKVPPFLKQNNLSDISNDYGLSPENIHEFYLPRDYCYEGSTKGFKASILHFGRKLLWLISRRKLNKFISTITIDFIHLNSVTLNELVQRQPPTFLHIREIISQPSAKSVERILSASGLIFIDSASKASLQRINLPSFTILNNPFNMSNVVEYNKIKLYEEYNIDELNTLIISMIGNLSELKGVAFVIEAIKLSTRKNIKLLVVGKGSKNYSKKCIDLAKTDSRIKFIGEVKEIEKIYRISDYIIRGDETFRIGRTIFEGLYSGCNVIIPGTESNLKDEAELSKMRDKIHFYSPRNLHELKQIIDTIKEDTQERVYISNVDTYSSSFYQFISNALN